MLDLAQELLHIVLWSTVLFGMATVFSGAMRAGGTVWMPMLLSIFAIVAVEVPAAVVLSRRIGIEGVWMAYPIAFCAMFVLQMGYYLLVWRKRAIAAPDLTRRRALRYDDHHYGGRAGARLRPRSEEEVRENAVSCKIRNSCSISAAPMPSSATRRSRRSKSAPA